jgi:AhpD family alkylhydroperoxidase
MRNISFKSIRNAIVVFAFLVLTIEISAQGTNVKTYEDTKKEIESMFGFFPLIFKAYPAYALPGAWENFKELGSPDSKIPPKYRELIQLAVASQIPCVYCIYFHTASAKIFGASDEEIKEAIAQGASTRHWSMILQGNEVDFEAFKKEVQLMLKKMTEQPAQK